MRNLVLFGRCIAAALLITAASAPSYAAPVTQSASQQQNHKVQGTGVDENGVAMVGV